LQRFRRVEAALLPDDVTLIQTAKLNDVDPQAWLADVLARLPDHPARRIEELLPWQWCGSRRLAA
jgi:transposase